MKSLSLKDLKIALVYDRVNTPYGGAEKVLLALHQLFPQAPLYTSVYDAKKAFWAKNLQIIPSFLQKIPWAAQHHRLLVALMPLTFESLKLQDYDLVISITSAEAKGILTRADQIHLCYLLTPTRYLYSHKDHYLQSKKIFTLWPMNIFVNLIYRYLFDWDQIAAHRPDYIIPISRLVQTRCQNYYHRPTQAVVYPPVEKFKSTFIPDQDCKQTTHKTNSDKSNPSIFQTSIKIPQQYYLVVSRLVAYKRIDLAIQACAQLKQSLIIVGTGPEKKQLQRLIQHYRADNIMIWPSAADEATVSNLYNHCTALLMPGEEDFGISALEANAYGKPVILHRKSGAAELIIDGKHGLHLQDSSLEELKNQIKKLTTIQFDANTLRQNAAKYDTNNFIQQFKQQINQVWADWQTQQH